MQHVSKDNKFVLKLNATLLTNALVFEACDEIDRHLFSFIQKQDERAG